MSWFGAKVEFQINWLGQNNVLIKEGKLNEAPSYRELNKSHANINSKSVSVAWEDYMKNIGKKVRKIQEWCVQQHNKRHSENANLRRA